MEVGTSIMQIGITNWNSLSECNLIRQPIENGFIDINIIPNKHFQINIFENDNIIQEFNSQEIEFIGNGIILLILQWNKNGIKMNINRLEIEDNTHDTIISIPIRQDIASVLSIYKDPSINEACKYWVEWRKVYCSPSSLRPSHVAKTLFQQFNELRDNIESLKVFYTEICINKKLHFFTNVYASLRSLLYWPDNLDKKKKQNYKPLLYRLANSLELPLPVYASSILLKSSDLNDGSLPSGIVSAQNNPMASTTNKFSQYIIIDIQEWLNRLIFADSDGLEYSLKKLLFDSANSWGAHSDEDIPEKLDMLKQTTIMSDSITHSLILNVLEIVISLGTFILSKYEQHEAKPIR